VVQVLRLGRGGAAGARLRLHLKRTHVAHRVAGMWFAALGAARATATGAATAATIAARATGAATIAAQLHLKRPDVTHRAARLRAWLAALVGG